MKRRAETNLPGVLTRRSSKPLGPLSSFTRVHTLDFQHDLQVRLRSHRLQCHRSTDKAEAGSCSSTFFSQNIPMLFNHPRLQSPGIYYVQTYYSHSSQTPELSPRYFYFCDSFQSRRKSTFITTWTPTV